MYNCNDLHLHKNQAGNKLIQSHLARQCQLTSDTEQNFQSISLHLYEFLVVFSFNQMCSMLGKVCLFMLKVPSRACSELGIDSTEQRPPVDIW